MAINVTKPAINLREKLNEVTLETGIKGEELLNSDTSTEARNVLELDTHLFTDFESTGIDDNATSTAITIDSSEKVSIGGSGSVSSDSQVAIKGGNLELATAGAKYWIPRASDGALTGSLYSPSGSVVRLSGALTSAGTIEFEPRSSNGVIARVTGDGLCFGSDTAAANALDDYEQGTWAPSLGGTATYTEQNGTYTKIGRSVTLVMQLEINLIGTGSTSTISGVPFTAQTTSGSSTIVGYFSGLATNATWLTFRLNGGANTLQNAITTTAAAAVSANGSIFGNATTLYASITYLTD